MKNNSHNESMDKRLARLQNGSYVESIETLLNSIDNYFNNEIRQAADNYQSSLLFMGIHAAALTISEVFFNNTGFDGYKKFSEVYIDGESRDRKFSEIAELIHNWRNVLAHQWIGTIGHGVGYDYKSSLGWREEDGVIYINPRIYCEQYLGAFKANGKIWDYRKRYSENQLDMMKNRIIQKYINR